MKDAHGKPGGTAEVAEPLVRMEGVSRKYGRFRAVQDLDLKVFPGEAIGLIGPNGAGKTTTLRLMVGLLAPTEGRIEVAGYVMPYQARQAVRKIGYLPERAALYKDMRVEEYLWFRARLWGVERSRAQDRIEKLGVACGIDLVMDRVIRRLSKGMAQRVALAGVLVHDPDLLILDEPTLGLDPNQVREVLRLLRRLVPRKTLILCTHQLGEVERLCDRVVILNHGSVVQEVETRTGGVCTLWMEVECDEATATRLLDGMEAVVSFRCSPHPTRSSVTNLEIQAGDGTEDIRAELGRLFVRNGIMVTALSGVRQQLEDIFHRLTHSSGLIEEESFGDGLAEEEDLL
ncbi:MAG: ABC transporter ATP-binding protein [Verrucomicrobiota bacterium]|nr:ABC transporter ATP-binding protein [Verrucomicrobiota bacterium]